MEREYLSIETYCQLLLEDQSQISQVRQDLANGRRSGFYTMEQLHQLLDFGRQHQLDEVIAGLSFMIGWFYLDAGKYELALEYELEAYQIYDRMNQIEEISLVCNGLMCIYFALGLYSESINWGVKGLELAKQLKNQHYLFRFFGNMAINYFELGKYKEAREMYDSIKLLDVEVNQVNSISLLQIEASLLLAENKPEEAKEVIDQATAAAYTLCYENTIIESQRLKAIIYARLGMREECENAFKIVEALCHKNQLEGELLKTYLEWGKVYLQDGNYLQAENLLLKAYQKGLDVVDPLGFTNICTALIELYKNSNNFKSALFYFEVRHEHEKKLEVYRSDSWERRINQELESHEVQVYRNLYDELQHISRVGQSFTAKLSYQKLLEMVHYEIANMIPSDIMAITQLNSEEDCLEYAIYKEGDSNSNSGSIFLDDEGSLGVYCIKHKKNLLIHDLFNEHEKYQLVKDKSVLLQKGIQSLICCPLMVHDEVKGYIALQSYQKNAYTQRDLTKLSVLTPYIAIALENANLYKKADYLARYDSLSGVYNRFEIMKKGQKMIKHLDEKSLCVIMLDIDHFKLINDSYGHQFGDEVIRQVGGLLAKKNSESINVGRYGGEEFVFFLQGYHENEARLFAEQIREEFLQLSINFTLNITHPITASLGVYEYVHDMISVSEGIHYADQAMYQSKSNGRNQVTTYSQFCSAMAIV